MAAEREQFKRGVDALSHRTNAHLASLKNLAECQNSNWEKVSFALLFFVLERIQRAGVPTAAPLRCHCDTTAIPLRYHCNTTATPLRAGTLRQTAPLIPPCAICDLA